MKAITRRSLLMRTAATGLILGIDPVAFAKTGAGPSAKSDEASEAMSRAFLNPPDAYKAGVYWWWLDGAASKEGITADMEALKRQGISYALIFNSGSPGDGVPPGPPFMSDPWREYFRFAVREAARCGIELSVNICDGWNAGGPWVTKDDAIKDLVWGETRIEGAAEVDRVLSTPARALKISGTDSQEVDLSADWYRDIAVLACREREDGKWRREDMEDLTHLTREGRLRWQAPAGRWTVLRFGYVVRKQAGMNVEIGYHLTKGGSSAVPAWEIDPMSAAAMDRHFAQTGAKLVADAGELAGKTLKYLHVDSWEIGIPTWTDGFAEEFRARRGYDPIRFLPALVGKQLDSQDIGRRFDWDFRRTIADLIAQNYYGRLARLCHEHGLGTDCEAGGPFYTQFIDAMECQGIQDLPMGEFWSSREPYQLDEVQGTSTPFFHTVEKEYPFSAFGTIKQAAATAHVYGKKICQAESYTSMNADWTVDPYFLKALGDRAFCLGLTRQVLCFDVLQPSLTDEPGYEWEHVGSNFDRKVTWWPLAHGWLTYLARCQHLLRQGVFAADILYFAGETLPNFALLDRKPIPGYDFDVINAQALLARAGARAGKLVLPDGVTYRYLVLPEGAAESMTPAVLGKIRKLVEGGVTLVGARPRHSLGLTDPARSEHLVAEDADALWGKEGAGPGKGQVGKGRVISGRTLEQVLKADGLEPDVEFRGEDSGKDMDWLHRRDSRHDIYFLANLSERTLSTEAVIRMSGRVPELWDPVTGEIRGLEEFRAEGARTVMPLQFAPKQSYFIVFRRKATRAAASRARNFPALRRLAGLTGPWEVAFDPKSGGPGNVTFRQLEDWSRRPEKGIRYYSGRATYRKTFELPAGSARRVFLDLGEVKNLAQVRLNGKDLGIVWTAPWRVDITEAAVRGGSNELEIDVVNLWPNRLIGDGLLPKSQRMTRTNVTTYDTPHPIFDYSDTDADSGKPKMSSAALKLLPSGLLGPVTLLGES
jgi:hypothetical protein